MNPPLATRQQCVALDAADALAPLRELFDLPDGVIYLDGNSLGAMPRATASRVAHVVTDEWGQGLIRSWNDAGWVDAPQRVGAKIARLIGADANDVVAADSTSTNLFKVLAAALAIQGARRPGRTVIVSERSNFPTDLYIAQGLAQFLNGDSGSGFSLHLVDGADELASALAKGPAVVLLTHVNYRTGAMHALEATSAAIHAAGALSIWDLAHSAGAVAVELDNSQADFAVGCGYKYLNGGPGAPAFLWVAKRHQNETWQPLTGWFGHDAPFAFDPTYTPAAGIHRYLCGTPSVLGLAALDCGLDTVLASEPMGGIAALRAKSVALCDLFIALVQAFSDKHHLALASPANAAQRGSQVSFRTTSGPTYGFAVMQALIERGVIGDFRAPDILRFGFTPLYSRFIDVWDAAHILEDVLTTGQWQAERFQRVTKVT